MIVFADIFANLADACAGHRLGAGVGQRNLPVGLIMQAVVLNFL